MTRAIADSYACDACAVVVVVARSGRRWDAERGQWLCSKCFDVGRPSMAEIDAKLDALWRRNRGLPATGEANAVQPKETR